MNTWGEWTRDWAIWQRAAKKPNSTIQLRTSHIMRASRDLPNDPSRVTTKHLIEWLARQKWQPNTQRAYRASLRAFFAWTTTQRLTEHSPAEALPPVKIPRSRPRPTPETAFRDALRVADDRERLAILLGGICGLRRAELAATAREDVEADLVGHSLRVVGKGGHVRLVPLPDELARLILCRAPGWLFPSPHGGHLTPHHLGKIISRRLGHTTHTLRHRCASVAYAATGDLRAVQELLGHASPDTTAIYTAVTDAAVRRAVAATAA